MKTFRRGRTELIILHRQRKYIVETKVWGGAGLYEAGKKQLVAYLRLEGAVEDTTSCSIIAKIQNRALKPKR